MKKVQSVLCALVLALSLSSTVFAGNIHERHQLNGIIDGDVKADGILVSDLFTWGDITGVIVSIFGIIHGVSQSD